MPSKVAQRALGRHGHEAHHAGSGLLGAADDAGELVGELGVQGGVQIGAVVHDDLGVAGHHRGDVALVGLGVLAGDGVHLHAVVAHEGGGGVVLGGKRVGGAQAHLGARGHKSAHEVRRLGGHVHARADAHALQRALLGEALADAGEHRHVAVGPQDAGLPLVGQVDVKNVAGLAHRLLPFLKAGAARARLPGRGSAGVPLHGEQGSTAPRRCGAVSRLSEKPYASLTGVEGVWGKCGEKEHFGLDCPHFGCHGPTGAANLARKGYTFSRLCSRAHATDRAGACHVLGASRCSIP